MRGRGERRRPHLEAEVEAARGEQYRGHLCLASGTLLAGRLGKEAAHFSASARQPPARGLGS
jgi:hypothetical protein